MSSKKKNIYLYLGKVIFITLLIVLIIRGFFVESYTVSSSQMESTLLKGDRILIDKTAYGIRLPMTWLTIPFTFDKIGGLQSYSTAIQTSYKRLFTGKVDRNDIVLFNNPSEVNKPLDKRSLLLSRCIALPGDTIEMKQGLFFVGGEPYTNSPSLIEEYKLKDFDRESLTDIMEELGIPLRNLRRKPDTLFLQLNDYEAYLLNERIPDSLLVVRNSPDSLHSFKLMIPFKGKIIDLDKNNLIIYQQIILQELEGEKVDIENGALLINGVRQDEYIFKDDYYWMLSDNATHSQDSRSVGFIPFRNIVGEACFIWYSSGEKDGTSNRCFSTIK